MMPKVVTMAGLLVCVALVLALKGPTSPEFFSPVPGITYRIFDAVSEWQNDLNTNEGIHIRLRKSREGDSVLSGDEIFLFSFQPVGKEGSYRHAAFIQGFVDGEPQDQLVPIGIQIGTTNKVNAVTRWTFTGTGDLVPNGNHSLGSVLSPIDTISARNVRTSQNFSLPIRETPPATSECDESTEAGNVLVVTDAFSGSLWVCLGLPGWLNQTHGEEVLGDTK